MTPVPAVTRPSLPKRPVRFGCSSKTLEPIPCDLPPSSGPPNGPLARAMATCDRSRRPVL